MSTEDKDIKKVTADVRQEEAPQPAVNKTEPTKEAVSSDIEVEQEDVPETTKRIPAGGEFGTTDPESMDEVYRSTVLSGPAKALGAITDYIREFTAGLSRNDEDEIVFKDEEQRNQYNLIRNMLSCIAPQYNNGQYVFQDALDNTDLSKFTVGTNREGDALPFTATRPTNTATGVLGAIRQKRKKGNTIRLLLPATGIYVTFEAPTEADYCDYEVEQALETSLLGHRTYGLLLNTASGVHVEKMVDFSLRFAVDTSLDIGDMEISQALADTVIADDYGIILLGPIIAKFPGGIPWNLIDPESGLEEEVLLNLHRCIRTFNERMTPEQQKFITLNTKKYMVTREMVEEYRKSGRTIPSERWVDEETGISVHFKKATLNHYFEVTHNWVKANEVRTAEVLGNYPTDRERAHHTSLIMESQRLTRYQHKVAAICTLDENGDDAIIEDSPSKILAILEELSADRRFVTKFEDAVSKYDEDTRLSGFGYMPRGKTSEDEHVVEEGPMRGFVPLSPDLLFFGVSRAVYEVQQQLVEAYGTAG